MTDKNRLFVYINVFAATLLDNAVMKEYINEKLNTSTWRGFKNDMGVIPGVFTRDTDPGSFFSGISLEQYANSRDEGTYINAMYPGLMFDYPKWSKVIETGEFTQTSMYLDVPYDVYEKAVGEGGKMAKEVYDNQSKKLQTTVESLSMMDSRILH